LTVIKRAKNGREFVLCTNLECKAISNVPKKKAAAGTPETGAQEGSEGVEAATQ
jgi:hypothetical protein